jgi:hypothetical protein
MVKKCHSLDLISDNSKPDGFDFDDLDVDEPLDDLPHPGADFADELDPDFELLPFELLIGVLKCCSSFVTWYSYPPPDFPDFDDPLFDPDFESKDPFDPLDPFDEVDPKDEESEPEEANADFGFEDKADEGKSLPSGYFWSRLCFPCLCLPWP